MPALPALRRPARRRWPDSNLNRSKFAAAPRHSRNWPRRFPATPRRRSAASHPRARSRHPPYGQRLHVRADPRRPSDHPPATSGDPGAAAAAAEPPAVPVSTQSVVVARATGGFVAVACGLLLWLVPGRILRGLAPASTGWRIQERTGVSNVALAESVLLRARELDEDAQSDAWSFATTGILDKTAFSTAPRRVTAHLALPHASIRMFSAPSRHLGPGDRHRAIRPDR